MMVHAPIFHFSKDIFGVVDGYVWAFSHNIQLGIGHYGGDLKDDSFFGIKTCHLQIDPDQIIVQWVSSVNGQCRAENIWEMGSDVKGNGFPGFPVKASSATFFIDFFAAMCLI